MGLFDFFRKNKQEEDIVLTGETLKSAIQEVLHTDENIASQIVDTIKEKTIEKTSIEKETMDFDDFIDIISSSISDIYSFDVTTRLEICDEIDEFISENPEVFNSIRIYASYICYGSALYKLEQYRPVFIGNNEEIVKRAEKIINEFEKRSKIKQLIYMIAKDIVSYGDGFLEKIKDKSTGKIVNVGYIPSKSVIIVTDSFGNVKTIAQIKDTSGLNIADVESKLVSDVFGFDEKKVTVFKKNEFIHFSDGTIAGATDNPIINLIYLWRAIKILEQTMIIYKVSRAKRLVVFFLDVSGKAEEDSRKYIKVFVRKLKQVFRIDTNNGIIYGKNSQISLGEDLVIPIRKDSKTKVESIPADTSAKFTDDILPYHKRLLHNLLTAWVLSPEKTGKEEQEKEAFLRIVRTFQFHIGSALSQLYTDVLRSYGIKDVDVQIEFPSPDVEEEIRIIDTILRRVMVINQIIAVLGVVPPRDWVIKYVFKDLTANEIKELIQKIDTEIKKTQEETLGTETIFNDLTISKNENTSQTQAVIGSEDNDTNEVIKTISEFDLLLDGYGKEINTDESVESKTDVSKFIDNNDKVLRMLKEYMEISDKLKKGRA